MYVSDWTAYAAVRNTYLVERPSDWTGPANGFSMSHIRLSEPTRSLEPPAFGAPREIVPGIVWLRMPLPNLFDHINVYLFEERDGWALWDTGVSDEACRAHWLAMFDSFLGGRAPTRLVGSHFHPDHIGLAGWLHDCFAMPFYMTMGDYLLSRFLQSGPDSAATAAETGHYRRLGLRAEEIAEIPGRASDYQRQTSRLPGSFRRLIAGQSLELGGRTWRVLTAGGHAPELVLLWCAADHLLLSSDQVLPYLVPGVSVNAIEPDANPLGLYLGTLTMLREQVPDDVFVLPSHYAPFRGLHARLDELARHHAERSALLAGRCRDSPGMTAVELAQTLFRRKLSPARLSYVAESVLANLHYLLEAGRLTAAAQADGAIRFSAIA
jgi:glyoxylase-like metal-dependent hydrolase (beta-lactamase superfamily II)